jgi:hypothetical protein
MFFSVNRTKIKKYLDLSNKRTKRLNKVTIARSQDSLLAGYHKRNFDYKDITMTVVEDGDSLIYLKNIKAII